MNTAPIYGEAGFDARLKPTWRQLWTHIRAFNGPRANLRAEKLVMRAIDRRWPVDRLERLLARVIERERGPRAERERKAMETFLEVAALDPLIARRKAMRGGASRGIPCAGPRCSRVFGKRLAMFGRRACAHRGQCCLVEGRQVFIPRSVERCPVCGARATSAGAAANAR